MLTQKAELACKHRLRVKYYLRWRLEMTRATIIQQKSHVALCQWSIILERKVGNRHNLFFVPLMIDGVVKFDRLVTRFY